MTPYMSNGRKVAYLGSYYQKVSGIGKIFELSEHELYIHKVTSHYAELFIEQRDQNMEE